MNSLSSKLCFGFESGGSNMQYMKLIKAVTALLIFPVIACSCTRKKL